MCAKQTGINVDITTLITRLQLDVPLATTVDHAQSLDADETLHSQAPALYLHAHKEKSEESKHDNLVIQKVADSVAVISVVPPAQLHSLRQQLMTSLIGYQIDPQQGELQHSEGEALSIIDGYIWWRDTFTTTYQRRQR